MDPSKQRLMAIVVEMLITERARVAYLCEHCGITPGDLDTEEIGDEITAHRARAAEHPDVAHLHHLMVLTTPEEATAAMALPLRRHHRYLHQSRLPQP